MTTRTRRTLIVSAVVVAILAAIISAAVWLRRAAPQSVRLLPESDAVVYVNLGRIRTLTAFHEIPRPQRDPEYQKFVDATGFEFERDLDEAAFAIHSGTAGQETRYSEVFVGHFDAARVSSYLKSISKGVERYREVDIYSVPVEDRTVRVALIAVDSAAISNVDDPVVIHGIIDRSRQMARPYAGPELVSEYYKRVPIGSLAWALARIPATPNDPRAARGMTLPGGFDVFLPSSSTMVGSVRFVTSINARAEFLTPNEAEAKRFVDQANTFLALFQSIQSSAQLSGADPDVKTVFDSIEFRQEGSNAVLSASIPLGFLKKLVSEPPAQLTPQAEEPKEEPAPQKPQKKRP